MECTMFDTVFTKLHQWTLCTLFAAFLSLPLKSFFH